ncbi:MAG: SH3 domain-containing protein, partial [Litorilinea sp.]
MSEQTGTNFPPYIYGLHEAGGEAHMLQAGRRGWVLELAAIGLDGSNTPADFSKLAAQGLGVMVRINHAYGSGGTLPLPERYADFAAACARFVARSQGCHIWIIGNEPNHELEWPNGRAILPGQYAQAYALCRQAIRGVDGHANDLVLVAGSAPWNARTTYPGNEKGDWIRYFSDTLAQLAEDACDGFAIHTYTHDLDPRQITGDFIHVTPGYRHLRNEFRTYRDYMNAIPDRFRRLPVFITETDPTTRHQGWNPGNNVGWVQSAYREIAEWNKDPARQPIQALILYRWPAIPDQPEWAISTRPGIIDDFRAALRLSPPADYRVRLPDPDATPVVLEPGNALAEVNRWIGRITATAGLNLRTGPTTQHHILQQLPHETLVTVLAEVDEWLYIEALGQRGYVAADFVVRHDTEGKFDREFLKDRVDLRQAALAPPAEQKIRLDGANALWAERALANAWNQYGALLTTVSQLLNLDPAVGVAVFAIESGGIGFG